MRSERELIDLHKGLRKAAFDRLAEPLTRALEAKVAEAAGQEARDARTRDPR